jgi:hypothetical protein
MCINLGTNVKAIKLFIFMYREISLPADYNHSTNILLQIELFQLFLLKKKITRYTEDRNGRALGPQDLEP